MTYPTINGSEINGAEDGGSRGIVAARFAPLTAAFEQRAEGFATGRVGIPAFLTAADVLAYPSSFAPVRFGPATALVGISPAAITVGPVGGLKPLRFGTPSAVGAAEVGQSSSLQPVRYGATVAEFGQPAEGSSPTRFGAAGPVVVGVEPVGFYPVRFGPAAVSMGFGAGSLVPVLFGSVQAQLGAVMAQAEGIAAVSFGSLGPVGSSATSRPLRPTRFGQITVDRGTTC